MTEKLTELQTAKYNPESGHWYDNAGRVVELVPDAKGLKMVKPDVRHARKYDLGVGVTRITGILAKDSLVRWLIEQAITSAVTLPEIENEPLEARVKRIYDDYQAQSDKAREQGTALHAALNRYYDTRELPDCDIHVNAVHNVDNWLRQCGATDIRGEVGFRVPGKWGGTKDLECMVGGCPMLVDFKGVDEGKLADYKPYDENGYQLAGYDLGTFELTGRGYPLWYNVAISRQTGSIAVYRWENEKQRKCRAMFPALWEVWKIAHGWNAE